MADILKGFYHQPEWVESFFKLQETVYPSLNLRWAAENNDIARFTVPYGIFINNKARSILNTTRAELISCTRHFEHIQLGTVATAPEYRSKGYSRQLLEHVIEDHKYKVDGIFLFANSSVLYFYPKFGFMPVREAQFILAVDNRSNDLAKLSVKENKILIKTLLAERSAISNQFNINNYATLAFFHLYFMGNNIWYDSECDLIVVAERKEKQLNIMDIIGRSVPGDYLENLSWPGVTRASLLFTPDKFRGDIEAEVAHIKNDQLFVLPFNQDVLEVFQSSIRVPALAHT